MLTKKLGGLAFMGWEKLLHDPKEEVQDEVALKWPDDLVDPWHQVRMLWERRFKGVARDFDSTLAKAKEIEPDLLVIDPSFSIELACLREIGSGVGQEFFSQHLSKGLPTPARAVSIREAFFLP